MQNDRNELNKYDFIELISLNDPFNNYLFIAYNPSLVIKNLWVFDFFSSVTIKENIE